MRSNFNKVFNNPLPQSSQKIPDSYAKYISQALPKGLRYVSIGEGACAIADENGEYTISGLIFCPTEEQKKVLGENYSFDDVLRYIENSQHPMKLIPPESGVVKINDNDIEFKEIMKFPFLNIDTTKSFYVMIPPKFPDPIPVTIGGGVYEYGLILSRIANNSINTQVYESDHSNKPISVRICVNTSNNDIQFTMSCKPQIAKKVKDLAISLSIYNDFIDGKGKFNGNIIPNENPEMKKFDSNLVNFWVKVMEISNKLELEFVPSSENISELTVFNVERVYQNLINGTPVRSLKNIETLEVSEQDDGVCLNDLIGKCFGIAYETVEHFDFFGNRFELHELVGVCDAVIDSAISKCNGSTTVVLRDKSQNEKRYVSVLGFKNQEELDEFRKNNFDNMMNILSNAKSIMDLV